MVLALANQKGGTGKSTLAISVASQWMAKGKRVLLVDADPQRTAAGACATARANGLLAPDCLTPAGTNLTAELRKLPQGWYEHVVIDTPGRVADVQRAALMAADVALVPVSSTAADVQALGGVLESIEAAKGKNRELRAALVQAKLLKHTVIGRRGRDVLAPAGLPIFRACTHTLVAWAETLDRGQGVAQYEPGGQAADELRAVVAELERFHGGKA